MSRAYHKKTHKLHGLESAYLAWIGGVNRKAPARCASLLGPVLADVSVVRLPTDADVITEAPSESSLLFS